MKFYNKNFNIEIIFLISQALLIRSLIFSRKFNILYDSKSCNTLYNGAVSTSLYIVTVIWIFFLIWDFLNILLLMIIVQCVQYIDFLVDSFKA